MPSAHAAVDSCFPERSGDDAETRDLDSDILFNRVAFQVQRRVDVPGRGPPGRQTFKS